MFGKGWCVGYKKGGITYWDLYNSEAGPDIPESGWNFRNVKYKDETLKISKKPLEKCGDINISGAGGSLILRFPEFNGLFLKTNKLFNGKSVFENENQICLFSLSEGRILFLFSPSSLFSWLYFSNPLFDVFAGGISWRYLSNVCSNI